MRLELVRDWMSREVVEVSPETSAAATEALMIERSIRRLPVMEEGRLVGIVTLEDIRTAPKDTARKVASLMAEQPVTVNENETIGRAAQLMLENKIGGLPVVDAKGQVVGIMTESDIFRLVVHDWLRAAGDESEPYARYR